MIHPTLQSLGNAERGDEGNVPAVVLLTGADRLSLGSVAFSLLDGRPDAGMIAYDVRVDDAASAGLSVVRRCLPPIGRGGACDPTADVLGVRTGETESLPVDECCLSCTVKHDLERQLGVWAQSGVWRDGGAVGAETPAVLVMLPVGVEGCRSRSTLRMHSSCMNGVRACVWWRLPMRWDWMNSRSGSMTMPR